MTALLLAGLLGCGLFQGKKSDSGADGRVFHGEHDYGSVTIRPSPSLDVAPTCDAKCPDGTQVARYATATERNTLVDRGGFLLVEGQCESLCVPIQPCLPPAVPVVDESGFTCRALAGFSTIPAATEVDLDFGLLWDPAEHTP